MSIYTHQKFQLGTVGGIRLTGPLPSPPFKATLVLSNSVVLSSTCSKRWDSNGTRTEPER